MPKRLIDILPDTYRAEFRILAESIVHAEDSLVKRRNERDCLIRRLRDDGMTLDAIADMAGMTKQRVHQITTSTET